MKLPAFLSQKDNSLVYNGDGEFLFYLPESYFADVKKNPIAMIIGQYVSTVGICDWAIMNKDGKVGESHPFKFPTIILCKPSKIEKVKNLQLNDYRSMDYRVLHFKNGDEVISDINIPQIVDNAELVNGMISITSGKLPRSIPYDKLHEYCPESLELNGSGYGLNMQLFGIMISELCRDPHDLSKPFRHSNIDNMNNYQQISVKMIPKYTSPYVALTSENLDESIMASILLSDEPEKDIKYSPLEKIIMS